MDAIAYQQSEIDDAELRIAIRRRHFLDIGFGTGDGVCQRGDDAALVGKLPKAVADVRVVNGKITLYKAVVP